jgi:hypothetical protein
MTLQEACPPSQRAAVSLPSPETGRPRPEAICGFAIGHQLAVETAVAVIRLATKMSLTTAHPRMRHADSAGHAASVLTPLLIGLRSAWSVRREKAAFPVGAGPSPPVRRRRKYNRCHGKSGMRR